MKLECPKCGSLSAWFQYTHCDKILRCLCGYHRVVETKLESVTIEHNDVGADVKLPKKDTHLWRTLMVLSVIGPATTADITQRVNGLGHAVFTVSDVASYLTILRSKGLVVTTTVRRGVSGGSTWELTTVCRCMVGAF